MSNPLETYLRDLRDIRSSGSAVKETSYYGSLEKLFNAIGKNLKPRVRCIINLQNRGAGIPDGGFFSADQFQKASAAQPLPGLLPSRGAMEVKGTRDEVDEIKDSQQVAKYLGQYGLVLVTNLRDFLLIGKEGEAEAEVLESYRLADNEAAFWSAAADPQKVSDLHGERSPNF